MIGTNNNNSPSRQNVPGQGAPGQSSSEGLNIKELLGYFLSKWYWIVISVGICLVVASYRLMKTTPAYSSTITVLFKSNQSNGGTNAIPDLSQLGLSSNNANLANEMITIRSISLLTEVVEALDLNNAYYMEESLHQRLLYKNSPLLVRNMSPQPEAEGIPFSFVITMTSPAEYLIEGVGENPLRGRIGQTIRTPYGPFRITTTPEFNEQMIGKPVTFVHSAPETVAAGISASLTYRLVEYSESVIALTVVDPSPRRAVDILNMLLDVYNKRWVMERNQAAANTSSFIDERLAVIENELGDVENNLYSYKSANLIDGNVSSGSALNNLASTKAEKLVLQNKIGLVKYLRREVQNATYDSPLPNPAGIGGTTVEGQLSEFNSIIIERNKLLETSSESNPVIQERTAKLEILRTLMVGSIDNYLLTLNTEMALLDTQEAKSTSDLMRSPSQTKYLLSVERQQKVKESLYLFLLQKREENELEQAFTAYNTRLINRPTVNNYPISPNKNSALSMALGIGVAIPLVIMFLIKNFDNKVRTRRDLRTMRTPFLGEIPFTGAKKSMLQRIASREKQPANSKRPMVVQQGNRNTINEAFRVVRANFEFIGRTPADGEEMQTIMVTSLYAGSGKTFISLNLGSALAAKGKKVLLIDLDMRKGSMSNVISRRHAGISNYIVGQASLEECLVRDVEGVEGLDLIPVGPIPPNPSELLYSTKFDVLIGELRKEYAYIIIDCPPVDIVADTHIISRLTDMTLFVIRAGLFDKSDLAKLHELYDQHRFKNLAAVLNGVDTASAYYGLSKYARYQSVYASKTDD